MKKYRVTFEYGMPMPRSMCVCVWADSDAEAAMQAENEYDMTAIKALRLGDRDYHVFGLKLSGEIKWTEKVDTIHAVSEVEVELNIRQRFKHVRCISIREIDEEENNETPEI